MIESRKTVSLSSDIEKVWSVVTDLENWKWRSDLGALEILEDGKKFVEYTKDGYSTTFVITTFDRPFLYEFTIENGNMSGTWSGVFRPASAGCEAEFTERVNVKKWFMRPFASGFLKKQQEQYFRDLKSALGE